MIKRKLNLKIILSVFCIFTVMAAALLSSSNVLTAYAFTTTTGTITTSSGQSVRLRATASTSAEVVTSLYSGTEVTVTDETEPGDGYTWYQISYNNGSVTYKGWVRGDCIRVAENGADSSSGSDTAQGTEGAVNESLVNVRSGPSTGYSAVTQVTFGQEVEITGQQSGTDGYTWYSVTFTKNGTSYSGWIRGDLVTVTSTEITETDADYQASLQAAGFPVSYAEKLAALHTKYPSWTFEPVLTGLDWNTVVEKESAVGKNLVPSSYDDSRKSTESTAYDWSSNTWIGFDGASWVAANRDYIAYCMDPRNYLTEGYIFQFETLEYKSYQTSAGTSAILANTFMANSVRDTDGTTLKYADAFTDIGSSLGVSPYHLASRVKQEQGTEGTSGIISGTYSGYTGYFNYFNVGAYTSGSTSAVEMGLQYAKSAGWNTRYKSLLGGSELLKNKYIGVGQNTLYFEKFNVVYGASLYSHQYMTNLLAAQNEGISMKKAYSDLNQAFVFRIPVYNNMPDTACTFTDTGNPNNWLSSLNVSGYSITPGFQGASTEYSLIVGQGVSSVTVNASPVASSSKVDGTGTYSLNYGNNTITVNCTSAGGSTRTYTLLVVREQPDQTEILAPGDVDIATSYKIDEAASVITGIEPGSSASSVAAQISTSGATVKILNPDGSENTGTVGTGSKVAVYNGNDLVSSYDVVIYGDLNGDGRISNADLVLMQKHILKISALSGDALTAGDVSRGNDGVSNKDLVILKKHILKVALISQ